MKDSFFQKISLQNSETLNLFIYKFEASGVNSFISKAAILMTFYVSVYVCSLPNHIRKSEIWGFIAYLAKLCINQPHFVKMFWTFRILIDFFGCI